MQRAHSETYVARWLAHAAGLAIATGAFVLGLAATRGAAQPGVSGPVSEVAIESARSTEAEASASAPSSPPAPVSASIDTANPYAAAPPPPPLVARVETRNPYLADASPAVRPASVPVVASPVLRATAVDAVNPYLTRDAPPAPRTRDASPDGQPHPSPSPSIDTRDPYSLRTGRPRVVAMITPR